MTKQIITANKEKLLNSLLSIYTQETKAVYGIYITWDQLKDEAKDRCSEDFDQALIARETLLEEILELKDAGIRSEEFEIGLKNIDNILLKYSIWIKEIYGLDVKLFLNVKQVKALPAAKKPSKVK